MEEKRTIKYGRMPFCKKIIYTAQMQAGKAYQRKGVTANCPSKAGALIHLCNLSCRVEDLKFSLLILDSRLCLLS